MGPMQFLAGDRLNEILDYIDATDEQKTQINAVVEDLRKDMETRREARKDNRSDMKEQMGKLLTAETFDRGAVENFFESRDAMRNQGKESVQTAMLDIAEVLTAEQRTKLFEKFQDAGERFGGKHGKRGQGQRW
jgi:Spy/CpxP family protein refolding chaperone